MQKDALMRPDNGEPAYRYVERVLREAAQTGATGIYLVPTGSEWIVSRQRGISREHLAELQPDYGTECVNRLKVLGSVLTYRTRAPQDGVIHALAGAGSAEFRIATLPTIHGERITIRLLNQTQTPQDLSGLHYPADTLGSLRALLCRPEGMLVLTGPTGSGKTTTIYAMVRELLATEKTPASIVSIEDPVETDLREISQVSVTRDTDECSYAAALRAALRQDVKTLVIGEMRDGDVVRIALEAALTGHRVLTTFHTGSIAGVYARMLHLGFEPFLIGSAVSGVVNQRLVPGLCPYCRETSEIRSQAMRETGTTAGFIAKGCEHCEGTGVSGMQPLAAVLQSDPEWCDFVASRPSLAELRAALEKRSCASLKAAACAAVSNGNISEKSAAVFFD